MSANRESIFDEARLLQQDRGRVYGSPYTNHKRIAELWSGLLEVPITAHQVVLCMASVKLARLVETPTHHDSIVDAVAYLAFYEDVIHSQLDDDYEKF
jgi:hypothetical protein